MVVYLVLFAIRINEHSLHRLQQLGVLGLPSGFLRGSIYLYRFY